MTCSEALLSSMSFSPHQKENCLHIHLLLLIYIHLSWLVAQLSVLLYADNTVLLSLSAVCTHQTLKMFAKDSKSESLSKVMLFSKAKFVHLMT